jgi:hypothetical protein
MKSIITVCALLFMGTVHAETTNPSVYGYVYGGYTNDALSLESAVLGAKYTFDNQFSAQIAVDASTSPDGKDRASLYLGNVLGKNLLLENDHLIIGQQYDGYVLYMEEHLGTRWLSPTFTQAAGLKQEVEKGMAYGVHYGKFGVEAGVHNPVPHVQKRQAYTLFATYAALENLDAAVGYQYDAAAEDTECNAAVIGRLAGGTLGLEYAHQKNKHSDLVPDRTSYAATGTYAVTPKYGAYAQYMAGDDHFEAQSGFKSMLAVGPTVVVRAGLNAALLYTNSQTPMETSNGVGFKFAAAF